jgi:protein O-mannosyl-transferase
MFIRERMPPVWQGGLMVLLVVLAYLPALHGGFIWDDDSHLTANPCIVGSLGFKGIWTSSAATYYPLVLSSFWLQHAIWGLNPLPYHLVNIAMHAACVVLLWLVLRCLKVRGAWFGAALWGLHPVQTESVAWITELKNTQSCLFYLLAIWFFLKWRAAGAFAVAGRKGTEWDYAFALLCAMLAILSKASTVMLPVVLGLVWWWSDGRWRWRNLFRLAPFFIISAAASGWTIWEQQFHSGAAGPDWSQSRPERFVIAGKAVWFYLGKLLWPHPLIFIYPRWEIDASRPTAWLPVLALGIILFLLWLNRRGRIGPVFFAFAYFVVSLFPVLGFFNVYFFRFSFVGDHFQYLAGLGPIALAAAGIITVLDLFKKGKPFLEPAFCGTLLLVLGLLTWRQCEMYTNMETLWRKTLAMNPDCWMAQGNLGICFYIEGRNKEAAERFHQAIQINPNYFEAINNLGLVLADQRRFDEAIENYRRAIRINPDYYIALNNLGLALAAQGRFDEAIKNYRAALQISPDYYPALNGLGMALTARGRPDEAIADFRQAVRIQPHHADFHLNWGVALDQLGRTREAVAQYQEALKLNPDLIAALNNLAWILASNPDDELRDGAEAVRLSERACELTHYGEPLFIGTLAAAYAEAGRFPEAVATAEKAEQIATTAGLTAVAAKNRQLLELYRAGKPYHEPAAH